MTILVTGGAGFIGSHLCERLIKEGQTVVCMDNLVTGLKQNIEELMDNPRFTFIEHDVTEELSSKLSEFSNFDRIYHLASPASPNQHSQLSYHTLAMDTMLVNTVGTHRMLSLAKQKNARFLFASTSEIYGDPLEHPQKEEYRGNVSTTGPRSVYDESKRFGETLTAYYQRKEGVDTRIARIFNTYGPRLRFEDMRMSVQFLYQALRGEPITIFGDGLQTRSLCYVDDLVSGLIQLMEKEDLSGEIVNLGSTDEHTVLDYALLIKRLTASSSDISHTEQLPEDDPRQRKPDIAKAKNLLGWEPKTSLEEGLKKTIDYYKTHSEE